MRDNIIYVKANNNNNTAKLFFNNIKCNAFIGKNGTTKEKIEGDKKTPLGNFEIGLVMGTHDENKIIKKNSIKYKKIENSMYWVDDSNSKYYNQLVNTNQIKENWKIAEHLIDFKVQYEYLIEIKSNPQNIPYKGSAVFLHCSTGNSTEGCVSVDKQNMIEIIKNLDEDTRIIISE